MASKDNSYSVQAANQIRTLEPDTTCRHKQVVAH